MEKKTLNLDFVELDSLENDREVCLMPCPCSGSEPSYSYTYGGTGGIAVCVVGPIVVTHYVLETIRGVTQLIEQSVISDSEAMAISIAEGEAMANAANGGTGSGGK